MTNHYRNVPNVIVRHGATGKLHGLLKVILLSWGIVFGEHSTV
jgi:hypothetical protein